MSHAAAPSSPHERDDALVRAIARECETTVDLVRSLYEQELADLIATAKVKQFVTVLAVKRVHDRLRRLKRPH